MAENAGHMDAALRLSAIVESSDDAIVSKDLNGIVTSWNRAAERMFGYTAVEMIGRSILVIIPDDRIGEEAYVLDCVRRRIGVDHYETERRHKDGHRVSVSLTVSPIRARTADCSAPRRSPATSASGSSSSLNWSVRTA